MKCVARDVCGFKSRFFAYEHFHLTLGIISIARRVTIRHITIITCYAHLYFRGFRRVLLMLGEAEVDPMIIQWSFFCALQNSS